MENKFNAADENKDKRGQEVDTMESLELFSVYLGNGGRSVEVAIPEQLEMLVKDNEGVEQKMLEAFRELKPVIDKLSVAITDAIKSYNLK